LFDGWPLSRILFESHELNVPEWVWRRAKAMEARIVELERNLVERKHIDATPDADYPLRILRTYRADCDLRWEESTVIGAAHADSPLTKALNELQDQRAVLLDAAIAVLAAARGGEHG